MIERIEDTKYAVTNFGEIINQETGNVISTFQDKKGYLKVNLFFDGKYHQFYVHRLVAEAFLEKPEGIDEKLLCVKHKDYDKTNNFVGNLEWDTFSKIVKDAHKNDIYKNHLASLKKGLIMIDLLNMKEVEFKSLLEAAMYLKSIKDGMPEVFAIRANISSALSSKTHMAYGYYWKEKE